LGRKKRQQFGTRWVWYLGDCLPHQIFRSKKNNFHCFFLVSLVFIATKKSLSDGAVRSPGRDAGDRCPSSQRLMVNSPLCAIVFKLSSSKPFSRQECNSAAKKAIQGVHEKNRPTKVFPKKNENDSREAFLNIFNFRVFFPWTLFVFFSWIPSSLRQEVKEGIPPTEIAQNANRREGPLFSAGRGRRKAGKKGGRKREREGGRDFSFWRYEKEPPHTHTLVLFFTTNKRYISVLLTLSFV